MAEEFQYIRGCTQLAPLALDEEFWPHQLVTVDFYFEPAQDLRPCPGEKLDEAYRAIGKQLMDAIWRKRLQDEEKK